MTFATHPSFWSWALTLFEVAEFLAVALPILGLGMTLLLMVVPKLRHRRIALPRIKPPASECSSDNCPDDRVDGKLHSVMPPTEVLWHGGGRALHQV